MGTVDVKVSSLVELHLDLIMCLYNRNVLTLTATIPQDTGHFGEADGQSILNSVRNSKPTILKALSVIITKKPAFIALHIAPAIVKQDLTNLAVSTAAFGNALIAAGPVSVSPHSLMIQSLTRAFEQDDLKGPATANKAELDAGFAKAIAAYST
jgi:hypothetical protein